MVHSHVNISVTQKHNYLCPFSPASALFFCFAEMREMWECGLFHMFMNSKKTILAFGYLYFIYFFLQLKTTYRGTLKLPFPQRNV